MAKDNLLWGAERIQGELLELGILAAKAAIQKYVRQIRPRQAPSLNWSTFLKKHAQDVWAYYCLPVIAKFFRPMYELH